MIKYNISAYGAPRSPEYGTECEVRVRLQSGWACGVHRVADNCTHFFSFLGVPYAAQPIGERRFRELEPVEPWNDFYDATYERPICPQYDVLYGRLQESHQMNEACIYANIHVPLKALPVYRVRPPALVPQPPHQAGLSENENDPGLPILVFIHGGGFAFGSGGIGLHGPEFLMRKDVIVITFNYRLNVFGFLSLNSSSIPGNNGLRDVVTLLQWVQVNAKSFGGDPNNVTLAGQSAGASIAHLISMSKAADGLFQRVILMSGTGLPNFFTSSPAYAELVANSFLSNLGINATDPEDIHRQLIATPIEDIMESNKLLQEYFGLVVFAPVVETPFPGVTTILDEDPEILMAKGCGINIPMLVGFTNAECETFRHNFEKFDILSRLKENPLLMLSPSLIFKLPPKNALDLAQKVNKRYFDGVPTLDKYIKSCSDAYYIYPAIKFAKIRASMKGAPVFLYQYSYEADFSVIKESMDLDYKGAGHIEDMTFIFRANAMEDVKGFSPPTQQDKLMANWMTTFVKDFIDCNDPTCNKHYVSSWPPVDYHMTVQYQNIEMPKFYHFTELTEEQQDMVQFFDSLQNRIS
ncbi:unnamed protein product [Euphydryas editha]|uniref:Carboxylic ester hydrolase n=1 Tax=Euphydryas editha TaxID=104508 RepID=A0AAU9U732_EUPED|nr:unnamed protein product [Euphydryas editha]